MTTVESEVAGIATAADLATHIKQLVAGHCPLWGLHWPECFPDEPDLDVDVVRREYRDLLDAITLVCDVVLGEGVER